MNNFSFDNTTITYDDLKPDWSVRYTDDLFPFIASYNSVVVPNNGGLKYDIND